MRLSAQSQIYHYLFHCERMVLISSRLSLRTESTLLKLKISWMILLESISPEEDMVELFLGVASSKRCMASSRDSSSLRCFFKKLMMALWCWNGNAAFDGL